MHETDREALTSCDDSMVVKAASPLSSMRCDGAWAYLQYASACFKRSDVTAPPTGSSAVDCPWTGAYTSEKTAPKECRDSAFGVESVAQARFTTQISATCKKQKVCDLCAPFLAGQIDSLSSGNASTAQSSGLELSNGPVVNMLPPGKICCYNETVCDYQAACSSTAADAANRMTSRDQTTIVLSAMGSGAELNPNGTCDYTLQTSLYNKRADATVCGSVIVTPSEPIYSCRLPANGLEADQSVCQADRDLPQPPPSLKYSLRGMTYDDVLRSDALAVKAEVFAPTCMSAEDLPVDAPQNPGAAPANLLASASLVRSPGTANAKALTDGRMASDVFQLSNRAGTSLCLDVVGFDSHGLGAGVDVYSCAPTSTSDVLRDERWYLEATSSGYFRIKNLVSNLCLEVPGIDSHKPSTAVDLYDCTPTETDAKADGEWRLIDVVDGSGYQKIQNRVSGLCLGLAGVDAPGWGTTAEVYSCDASPSDPGRDGQWLLLRDGARRTDTTDTANVAADGEIVWDLSTPQSLGFFSLQADGSDTFTVSTSNDGVVWMPAWDSPAMGAGTQTRVSPPLAANLSARYVRLAPTSGGTVYSVGEFGVYNAPPKNLLAGVPGVPTGAVTNVAKATDGSAPPAFTDWNTAEAAVMPVDSAVVWDLGALRHIDAFRIQADNNDRYMVYVSQNGAQWLLAYVAAPVGGYGLQTRFSAQVDVMARYVRVAPLAGDGYYSVGEIEAFDTAPNYVRNTGARAKFDRLEVARQVVPAYSVDPIVSVAQENILYQLHRDQLIGLRSGVLSETYLDRLMLNNAAYPSARPACGNWSQSETPAKRADEALVDAKLQYCDRLAPTASDPTLPPDWSVAEVAANLPYCIGAGGSVSALPLDGDGRQVRLDRWVSVTQRAAKRVLSGGLNPRDRMGDIGTRLGFIQAFYDVASTSTAYVGARAQERLWSDVESQVRMLATAVRTGGTTPVDPASFKTFIGEQFQADADILTAAFTGIQLPVRGVPMLAVLSSSLGALSDRAAMLDQYHDLSCRFQDCTGVETELAEVHAVLGRLGSPTGFSDVITNHASKLGSKWFPVFKLIADRHVDGVQEAVLSATGASTYTESLLTGPGASVLSGTWYRAQDGIEPIFWLNGSQITGILDVGSFRHRFFGSFDRSTGTAAVTVRRTNTSNKCETLMKGVLTLKVGNIFNLSLSGADNRCDIGTWYSESFDFARTAPGAQIEPLVALATIVKSNQQRDARYQKTGLFAASDGSHLKIGLVPERWKGADGVSSVLSNAVSQLRSEIQTYEGAISAQAANLLSEAQAQTNGVGLKAKRNQLDVEIAELAEDRMGLKEMVSADELRLARESMDFAEVMRNSPVPALVPGGASRFLGQVPTVVITAGDATYTDSRAAVANYAYRKTPVVSLVKGEALELQASGKWAPTCALSGQNLAGLGGINTGGAETGSEGYYVSYNGSSFDAHSVSTTDSDTTSQRDSWRAQACLTVEVKAKVPIPVVEASVSASASACIAHDADETWTQSNSESTNKGSENRTSVDFAAGLRLRTTPVTSAPAGSILVVFVPAGKSAPILDAKVLQARTVIRAEQDVDVYLVPNEKAGCAADTTKGVTVTMSIETPTGVIGPVLADALVSIHSMMRAEVKARLAQGQMLPHDYGYLQGLAQQNLLSVCGAHGYDCAQLPALIRSFIDNTITLELSRAEREAALTANLRRSQQLATELQGIADELKANRGASDLIKQLIELQRRRLDQNDIASGARAVLDILNDKVYPYYKVKYNGASTQSLVALRDSISIEGRTDELGKALVTAATSFSTALDSEIAGVPLTQTALVALAFPRPGSATYAKVWPEADAERSREVWGQIKRQHDCAHSTQPMVDCLPPELARIPFAVKLSDLYFKNVGNASLACSARVPVINSMGVYVAVPPTAVDQVANLNLTSNWTATEISGEMVWPMTQGPEAFIYDGDPGWSHSMLPVQYGTQYNALSLFSSMPPGAPAGTARGLAGSSVFSTFVMAPEAEAKLNPPTGLTDNFEPLFEAEAIVLLFRVDYQSGAPLTWGSCQ